MASRRAPGTETVDIVCGTLQAKLLTEDLSCGSSPCIQLGPRTISPCQFQREAGKASAKNWKATIRYLNQPLSQFLETYTNHSGKRCCRFVVPVDDLTRSPSPALPGEVENSLSRTLDPTPYESPRPPDLSTRHTALESINQPELPAFPPVAEPNFTWGAKDAASFCDDLNTAYKEVTQWQRNLFDTPRGLAGKAFVYELARLFRAVGQGTALESIALKAVFVASSLLLQHTCPRAKPTDNAK